jgi:RND family efflux transporter MFP subunit
MNRKIIIGVVVAIVTIGLIVAGILQATGSSSTFGGGSAVLAKTATIEKGAISSYISSDGKVEEVDKTELYLDTPLKVKKVLAEEGQEVTKGQQLLELDLDALNSQLETLKINRTTQQLSANSKALDAEVERAANNLKAAERSYNDAKKTYEDNKALYASNAISKSELDMSEKSFNEAGSGINGLENAKLAYNSAVENRKNSKSTSEENLKATDLQIADLEKKISTIKAECASPMDGVIASLSAEEGAYTSSMQPVYTIIDPDNLQIRAKVKEYDIKNVAVGQKVRITGEAIDKDKEIDGTVKSISPVAVSNATTSGNETVIEVLISVSGSDGVLKPGLNVTCEISTVNKPDAVLAPMEAITPDKDDNNMVFVVDQKTMTMQQKKVTVGINSDMSVEILDGLQAGDVVVLDPQPSYRDGLRVKTDSKE